MMRRCLVGGLVVLGLGISVLMARPGTVKTKDGRSLSGEVVETPDSISVTSHGVQATFKRDEILSLSYAQTNVQEEYKQRLAKLPGNAGAKEHLDLARWLFDSREYDLARAEAETALRLSPGNTEATDLLEAIRLHAQLERREAVSGGAAATTPPAAGGNPASRPATAEAAPRKFLSADQVQVIKHRELRPDEQGVRVQFTKDVVRRFMDYKNVPGFMSLSDTEKAKQILEEGTPEMRQNVRIVSDPTAMADFKRLQPIIMGSCATNGCHGGVNAKAPVLYNLPDNDAVYTNFYILTQYSTDMGGRRYKVIDRTHPADSLLLNYGLPRDQTEIRHPDVQGWRPVFASRRDPKYVNLGRWIESGLIAVEPSYDIDFPIPKGEPTTAATVPAQ